MECIVSCSLIGQLCLGGPDYSSCTVNSHAGIGIVKKLILWCLLPLLRLLKKSTLDYIKRVSTNFILIFTSLCRCYVFFWTVTVYMILIIWVFFSFLSSLSQTGNKLEWSFVCAFNTDKQTKHLSHLRFVSRTADQIFLPQIFEFFIHVIFYVIKHYIFVSFSFVSLYFVTWHMIIIIHVFKSNTFALPCFDSTEQYLI